MNEAYEVNTGKVIVEHITTAGYDPMSIPGAIVKYGFFSWGTDPRNAVLNAVVMEKSGRDGFKDFGLKSRC